MDEDELVLVTEWFVPIHPERTDAVFYCDGGADPVGSVKLTKDGETATVLIYCDGEMRAYLPSKDKVYRHSSEFIEDGFDTDLKLFSERNTFEWDMNPWFDLYTPEGDHLDVVRHDIFEAQADAEEVLTDHFQKYP
jgi:hypothetical protein